MYMELIEIRVDGGFAIELEKGGSHKYIKRVPTGKAKPKWKYYYKMPKGGIVHDDHLKVGSGFRHGEGEKQGHYHVVSKDSEGNITVRHDVTGHETTVNLAHLRSLIHEGKHGLDQREGHFSPKAKGDHLMKQFEEAKESGNRRMMAVRRRQVMQHIKDYPEISSQLTEAFLNADPKSQEKLKKIKKFGKSTFNVIKSTKKKGGKKYGGAKGTVKLQHLSYKDAAQDSLRMIEKPGSDLDLKLKAAQITGVKDSELLQKAFDDVKASVEKSANSESEGMSWMSPLEVNGQKIPGMFVYKGNDPAKRGNVYMSGILESEEITDQGFGRAPASKSKDLTKLKSAMRSMLPLGKWRSYRVNMDSVENIIHTELPQKRFISKPSDDFVPPKEYTKNYKKKKKGAVKDWEITPATGDVNLGRKFTLPEEKTQKGFSLFMSKKSGFSVAIRKSG